MEELPVEDPHRLAILVEEVGEVAREFCEARHCGEFDLVNLRKELIQVAAMSGAWADRLKPS
jgi:NTP pyrophosphatase (non-canonical NTP hydrolase)